MNKDALNELSNKIIGLSIQIHKELGSGFIEKVYTRALSYELKENKIEFVREKLIKVKYKDINLGEQKLDFLIENVLVLELKTATEINEAHFAQLLSYLKIANKRLGLILNFANKKLEIRRIVNNF